MPSAEVWTAGSSLGARIVEVVRPNWQRRGMVLLVQCWYTVSSGGAGVVLVCTSTALVLV